MSDLLLVTIMDRGENDFTGVAGFFFVVVRLLYNSVEKLSTHHLFCNQPIAVFNSAGEYQIIRTSIEQISHSQIIDNFSVGIFRP